MSKFGDRLTYGNVMATIAVFIALGAGAYAAGLPKNSVKSKQIKAGAVRSVEIRDGQVSSADVADEGLTAGDVKDGEGSGLDADTLDGRSSAGFLSATATATDADRLDNLDSSAFQRTGAAGTSSGGADTLPANGSTATFPVAGGTFQYLCVSSNALAGWQGPQAEVWLDKGGGNPFAPFGANNFQGAVDNNAGERYTYVLKTDTRVAEIELYSVASGSDCRYVYMVSEYQR
jgi:hypothetical protein